MGDSSVVNNRAVTSVDIVKEGIENRDRERKKQEYRPE